MVTCQWNLLPTLVSSTVYSTCISELISASWLVTHSDKNIIPAVPHRLLGLSLFIAYIIAMFAATLVEGNLLVFGGTGIPFGDAASNQIHKCDLNRLTWTHFDCTGHPPTKGYGHVSLRSKASIIIYF